MHSNMTLNEALATARMYKRRGLGWFITNHSDSFRFLMRKESSKAELAKIYEGEHIPNTVSEMVEVKRKYLNRLRTENNKK